MSSFALLAFTASVAPFEGNSNCYQSNVSDSFCSFGDSFYHSYTLFIGAEEFEEYEKEAFHKARVLVFQSISTIIVLNVIIAIVNDSFGSVSDEAERLFWLNRLYFVSEIEGVRNFFLEDSFMSDYIDEKKKIQGGKHVFRSERKYDELMYIEYAEEGRIINNVDPTRLLFDILMSAVYNYDNTKDRLKKENLFKVMNNGNFRWIVDTKLIIRRIFAVIILPSWVIIGLLSAGWFWPPQLRELFLCSDLGTSSVASKEQKKNNHYEKVHRGISNNNKENRINCLEDDMLKIVNEVQQLKNAVNDMRADYDESKKQLIDEMKLVKSVLDRVNMKLNMFN